MEKNIDNTMAKRKENKTKTKHGSQNTTQKTKN
jgi:hypothetical protein